MAVMKLTTVLTVAALAASTAGAQGYTQTSGADPVAAYADMPMSLGLKGTRVALSGNYALVTQADPNGGADVTTDQMTLGVDVEVPVNESSSVGVDATAEIKTGALAAGEQRVALGSLGANYRYYLAPDHQGVNVGARLGLQSGDVTAQATAGYVTALSDRVYVGADVRAGVVVGSWKPAYSAGVKVGMTF